MFSLKVAILVLRVSSLSSARFSVDAAARFKIRATRVSFEHSKYKIKSTGPMTFSKAAPVNEERNKS